MPSPENLDFRNLSYSKLLTVNGQAQKDERDLLISAGFTFLATAAGATVALETDGNTEIGAGIFAIGAFLGTAFNFLKAIEMGDLASLTYRELISRRLEKYGR